jgi:DNA-binding response OmpR family regulator
VGSVLIVDDSELVRTVLRAALADAGFEAATADDSAGAVRHAPGCFIALVDAHLDDAAELAETLRHGNPAIQIVVMTSLAKLEDIAFADAVLPKPFTLAQLTAVVTNALNGR